MQTRLWQRDSRDRTVLQPTPAAAIDVSHHFFFSQHSRFKTIYLFLFIVVFIKSAY